MKYEVYDYDILYFDNEYKNTTLKYVVDKIVDKEKAETKFIFISELDKDNKAILDSITLPYAVVQNIRVLSFYIYDDLLVKKDDIVENQKHTMPSRKRISRNFKVKCMGGARKFI